MPKEITLKIIQNMVDASIKTAVAASERKLKAYATGKANDVKNDLVGELAKSVSSLVKSPEFLSALKTVPTGLSEETKSELRNILEEDFLSSGREIPQYLKLLTE